MHEIKLIRSKRRSIVLEIRPDLSILVRAPLRMKQADIDRFVELKQGWLETNFEKMKAKILRLEDKRAALGAEEQKMKKFNEDELKELVARAKEIFHKRVEYYAPIIGVTYGRITIRKQVSRFGSCSSKGNLNFNCLLLLAPEEVLDYVVVHELCHRKHMNHSKLFWTEVENTLPDYKQHKKWLKDNGFSLIGKLP